MTTYSYAEMLAHDSSVELAENYRRVTLWLDKGDVAPSCCSTKWDIRAIEDRTRVEYYIAPSGIEVVVVEGDVGRHYRTEVA